MKKVGIIPAAGLGLRWGRFPKFILPCGDREWMLDHTIKAFPEDVSRIYIVHSPETLMEIVHHLWRCDYLAGEIPITLIENKNMDLGLWGSFLAGLAFEADYYYFAMPDTYFPHGVFEQMEGTGIRFGAFYTEEPERFGMIRGDKIIDKQEGEFGWAYGIIGWDRKIRDFWLASQFTSHTSALSSAMKIGYETIQMEFYQDFATWNDYVEFVIWQNLR